MKLQWPTKNKSIVIALAISGVLHLILLLFHWPTPPDRPEPTSRQLPTQLDVRIAKPETFVAPPPLPRPATPQRSVRKVQPKPMPKPVPSQRPAPRSAESVKTWTPAEKEEMNRFLSELNTQPRPRTGRELEQAALDAARTLEKRIEKVDETALIMQRLREAKVEPLSIELYYEALFRKLNRSAEMVKNKSKEIGSRVAVVRAILNPDGTVKSFTVLKAADQQAEIAYIQSVIDRAAPFPAFPPDIRKATDKMILQICIQPQGFAAGGGAFFSRLAPGEGCQSGG